MVIELPITSVNRGDSYDRKTGLMRVEMDAGIFRMELTMQGEHIDTIEVSLAELTEGLAAIQRVNDYSHALVKKD